MRATIVPGASASPTGRGGAVRAAAAWLGRAWGGRKARLTVGAAGAAGGSAASAGAGVAAGAAAGGAGAAGAGAGAGAGGAAKGSGAGVEEAIVMVGS